MGIKNIVNKLTASKEANDIANTLTREVVKEKIKEWIYLILNTAVARGDREVQFDALFDVVKLLNYIATRPLGSGIIALNKNARFVRIISNNMVSGNIELQEPEELLEMIETRIDSYVENYYRNYCMISGNHPNRGIFYLRLIKRFNTDLEEIRTHVLNDARIYIPDLDLYGFNDDEDLSWVNESLSFESNQTEIIEALTKWIETLIKVNSYGDEATLYDTLIGVLQFLNRTTGWVRFQRLMLLDRDKKLFSFNDDDYDEGFFTSIDEDEPSIVIETADELLTRMSQLAEDYAASIYIYFFTNEFSTNSLEEDIEDFNKWVQKFNPTFKLVPFELDPLRDTDLSWVNEAKASHSQFLDHIKMLETWYKELIAFNFPKGEAVDFNKVSEIVYLFKNTNPKYGASASVYAEKLGEGRWLVTSYNLRISDRQVTLEQWPEVLYELAAKYAEFNAREFSAEAKGDYKRIQSSMVNEIREFLSGYESSLHIIAFDMYADDAIDLSWANESIEIPIQTWQQFVQLFKEWYENLIYRNMPYTDNFFEEVVVPTYKSGESVIELIDYAIAPPTSMSLNYDLRDNYVTATLPSGSIYYTEGNTYEQWLEFCNAMTTSLAIDTSKFYLRVAGGEIAKALQTFNKDIEKLLSESYVASTTRMTPLYMPEDNDLSWANEAATGTLTKSQVLRAIEDWLEDIINTTVEKDNENGRWFDELDYMLEIVYILLIELVDTDAENFRIEFSQADVTNSTLVTIGNSSKVYGVPYGHYPKSTQKMADEYKRLITDLLASVPDIAEAIYRTQTFENNQSPQQVADGMNEVIKTSHHDDTINVPLIVFNTYKEDISWANESVEPEVIATYTEDVLEWLEDSLVSLYQTAKENDDVRSSLHDFIHTILDYATYSKEPVVSKIFYNQKHTDEYLFNFIYSELPRLTNLFLSTLALHSSITSDNIAEDLSEKLNSIAKSTSKSRRMSGKVRTIFLPFTLKSLYKEDVSWMNEAAILSSVPSMSEILDQVTRWMTEWISNNDDGTLKRLTDIISLLNYIAPRGPVFTFKRNADGSADVGIWINSYLKDIINVTEDTSHILRDLLLKHAEDFSHAITLGYLLQGSRRDVLDATALFNEILQNGLAKLDVDLVVYDLELEQNTEDLGWAFESFALKPIEALINDVQEWLEESLFVLKQRESALGTEIYFGALKDFRDVITSQADVTLPKKLFSIKNAEKLYAELYKALPKLAENIVAKFDDALAHPDYVPTFLNIVQKNQHVRKSSYYGSNPRPLFIPFEKRAQHDYKEDVSWMNESEDINKQNPCLDGYEMIGMKEEDGRQVPNCVLIEEKK